LHNIIVIADGQVTKIPINSFCSPAFQLYHFFQDTDAQGISSQSERTDFERRFRQQHSSDVAVEWKVQILPSTKRHLQHPIFNLEAIA
jgi:hypothetical protein